MAQPDGHLKALLQQIYSTQHHDDHAALAGDDFRIYGYKIIPCSKTVGHDWTACPFSHANEKAARRCPVAFTYTAIACPDMKKVGECPRQETCMFAHNVFEYWLHPSRYRTQLCSYGMNCRRSVCFFAHYQGELRVVDKSPQLIALESQLGAMDSAFGLPGNAGSAAARTYARLGPTSSQQPGQAGVRTNQLLQQQQQHALQQQYQAQQVAVAQQASAGILPADPMAMSALRAARIQMAKQEGLAPMAAQSDATSLQTALQQLLSKSPLMQGMPVPSLIQQQQQTSHGLIGNSSVPTAVSTSETNATTSPVMQGRLLAQSQLQLQHRHHIQRQQQLQPYTLQQHQIHAELAGQHAQEVAYPGRGAMPVEGLSSPLKLLSELAPPPLLDGMGSHVMAAASSMARSLVAGGARDEHSAAVQQALFGVLPQLFHQLQVAQNSQQQLLPPQLAQHKVPAVVSTRLQQPCLSVPMLMQPQQKTAVPISPHTPPMYMTTSGTQPRYSALCSGHSEFSSASSDRSASPSFNAPEDIPEDLLATNESSVFSDPHFYGGGASELDGMLRSLNLVDCSTPTCRNGSGSSQPVTCHDAPPPAPVTSSPGPSRALRLDSAAATKLQADRGQTDRAVSSVY